MNYLKKLILIEYSSNFKNYYLTFVFFLFSVALCAQKGTVTGTVLDKETKQTIPYANIILKVADKIISGGITDDYGKFKVSKIELKTYNLQIQFIGFKPISKTITFNKNQTKIDLGNILLEEDAVSLNEIAITSERSTIVQKVDRKVISIGKDLTTVGASASDIMTNIPSVTINQDGDISLRGNENVRILIDGKPTNLSARELLQQIPATSLKTIELITNPSAKYNPEGMSGIINFILKKDANLGFNGSFNSGFTYGERARYNNAINLNYRKGKLNFYGNYGNRLGKSLAFGNITRTIERVSQTTNNVNDNTSHLVKLGFDYFINNKNTFSFYTNRNFAKNKINGNRDILFFDNSSNNFNQIDITNTNNTNASYNFDFKHNFEKEKHSVELEVDYNTLDSDNNYDFIFSGNKPSADYVESITNKKTNTTINLDYTKPLLANTTLELGVETRLRNTDNIYQTGNPNFNNATFSYDREIYSFYATFSQFWNKWQYNIGLRLEDYNVNAQFFENGKTPFFFTDKLFNVFPSGFLKYTPSKTSKNAYQFSFSRRIDRPSLNQINPIRQLNTPQIVITGNPSLVPQFTNSIELNYIRKINKGNVSFGSFYRQISNEINRRGFFDADNPNLLIIDYDNFNNNNAYGLELSASYKPLNWWTINSSFDVYSRAQKGVIENENVSVNNTLLNAKINQSFKATKNLTFQLFALYTGKQKVLQYELKENYFVNAGARYNFAKGKGTLSINFNDIFKTQRFAFEAYRTIIQTGEFRRDSRSVFVGLSYLFGGNNKNVKRKKRDRNEKADKFL
ncbi:TonB-dependent receptor domain-containing protein [Polaribacter cellanae]|uniref:TonB-dependent receptor n=1 Tax=Polaribacter cellanae TaxID=2818493 RepID=A0A975CT54_9FLAO|nr:outer membrane beta-barrel family protein [Polaribacter cellanae]QTE23562.1 TonB-dependent receptor [Polaribacter cellanae]